MNAQLLIKRIPLDSLPDSRLARAEFLKLRKRRGLVLSSLLLTAGAAIIVFAILAILHAIDPSRYGPAGGFNRFRAVLTFLNDLGIVAAILIGAVAGAGDQTAGVFRSLVVTGRSRLALFAARIPGGLALLVPIVALTIAIVAVASVMLAGSRPTPGIGIMIKGGLWIELSMTVRFLIALGFASLIGSVSTTLAVLIPFEVVVTHLLLGLNVLTGLRELFPGISLAALAPASLKGEGMAPDLTISLGAIIAILLVWTIAALGAGAWRTRTQDA